ncbi:hypothetical protein, partial [Dietzia alimentaria]|uniref:hypothetical protein n=1 Tax=Dietzia alimentaria TaxID=665550 RepID=UPI000299F77E
MDHRDYMGDWTYRIMEESKLQIMGQLIPNMLVQPAIDLEKFIEPRIGLFGQLYEHFSKLSPS